MRRGPKTSIEILHERDALRTRVEALESAIVEMTTEIERGLRSPELHFLVSTRALEVARRTLGDRLRPARSPAPLRKTEPRTDAVERRANGTGEE